MAIPRYRIGEEAARVILGRIDGELVPGQIVDLGFEVVTREST